MTLAVIKTSVKGQLVIPQKIRQELGIKDGQLMIVYSAGDRIILKKVKEPEPGLFSMLAEPIRVKVKERKITRRDVEHAIRDVRGRAR
ncbi:MAG: AbrB/MazE/SpoVT family DNA-binding domain-containing protein [Candidatus Hadarchaeum sp.]|jgi:AbrB family looped-hinge helix DNA binding protein|nr:AbrB/MazE/SpoVT family DNA-binding domain-containing protein [Candidatus Hadarchaeum sp.]